MTALLLNRIHLTQDYLHLLHDANDKRIGQQLLRGLVPLDEGHDEAPPCSLILVQQHRR